MKSLIKKISGATAMALFAVNSAFAQSGQALFNQQKTGPDAATTGSLGDSLVQVLNYFLGLLGFIAVAFLVYSGILMVTAGGNDEQVTKARKIIMYAIIGLVIILLSFTIVQFVSVALG